MMGIEAEWIPSANETIEATNDALSRHVLTFDGLLQGVLVIAALALAWLFAAKSAKALKKWGETGQRKTLFTLRVSAREVFFFLYLSLILWFSTAIISGIGYNAAILRTLASLSTAWALIRLISGTLKSEFWAKLISVTLWAAAALSILGVLDSVLVRMDEISFTAGKLRISVLLLVKALVIFCLLLWIVNFLSRILERSFSKAGGLTSSQKVLFYKLSNIALYGVAIFIGLNIIGLDLTTLAVFGGALGLGIGFGLQKIFSNLISGIILLIDKSVKPGDVIAIGDTYGWVNKLGARYVSVLTRDGKEHLIPNENLISEQVENWSYSDSNIRIHVPVGVSYDSDMHKVKEILLTAAKESPRILKSKPIACLMKDFGDNSVNFELRGWISDPQEGVSNVKSEIYFRIWDLFKENGIEIPFPQRDLHLKVDDELRDLLKKT